jgi:hypothetical protein
MANVTRGRADYLALGDWNARCSLCGKKLKASEMERNWQGLYRCPEHNEPRQPQDFVRGVMEHPEVPWAQPTNINYTMTSLLITENSNVAGGVIFYLATEDGYPLMTEN